jgi:cadmium resistance protein CadD (predicted permease)
MSSAAVVARAIGAFVATNVDGLVLIALLLAVRRGPGAGPRSRVMVGTFLGFAVLVAVSIGIAVGSSGVPVHWFGLFGVVPLGLGLWGLSRLRGRSDSEVQSPALAGAGAVSVAALTVANGGDNVSLYVPLFRSVSVGDGVVTVVVFGLMLAVWCVLGTVVANRSRVVALIERGGHVIAPTVLVAVGLVVLASLLT